MSDKIREGDPDLPRKKRTRPRDDDEDDRFERKRRNIARDDDDGGNSPLSAVVPLGVSIWALLSFYLSLLSCLIPGLGLLAILFGAIAFFTHKHQASYGSVTGNMRAVLGIMIGVLTSLGWMALLVIALMNR